MLLGLTQCVATHMSDSPQMHYDIFKESDQHILLVTNRLFGSEIRKACVITIELIAIYVDTICRFSISYHAGEQIRIP